MNGRAKSSCHIRTFNVGPNCHPRVGNAIVKNMSELGIDALPVADVKLMTTPQLDDIKDKQVHEKFKLDLSRI